MWNNRKVLVTGATGLLGTHLCEELCLQGAEVIAMIRDYVPKSRYYDSFKISSVKEVNGDVTDFQFVNRVLNEYQIQTVFHLAAQTQVGIANKNPMPTLQTNIMGTVNILEAARINETEQVVIASSDKAYGDAHDFPYTEKTALHGVHPYDVSKSCADLIAQTYHETYLMNIGITRCGNLFGPGDLNFNRIIPGTIQSLMNNHPPIIRSDGKMIRDYFYVKDAVNAYMKLAEGIIEWPGMSYAYNFSYNEPMSVIDIVKLIAKLMDKHDYDPIIQNNASNEIYYQSLDSSLARSLLGWGPQWTQQDALLETIEWYQENL